MEFGFDYAVKHILKEEGGYVDHKTDPGGATNYGISLRFMIAAAIDPNRDGRIDVRDIRAMTPEVAASIYKSHFWDRVKGDSLPGPLALLVFDSAVNQGVGRASKFLQRVVGASPDGMIGPKTLKRVSEAWDKDASNVLSQYAVRRALHYSSLSIFASFGRGWFNRLFRVYGMAAEALGSMKGQINES